jgi:hypothetical protein
MYTYGADTWTCMWIRCVSSLKLWNWCQWNMLLGVKLLKAVRRAWFLFAIIHVLYNTENRIYKTQIKKRLSQWPRSLRRASTADCVLGLLVRVPPWTWMAVCCCKVEVFVTGRSLVQRNRTDSGVSLCVIWKPQEWGGPGPRWAVARETPKKINIEKERYCNCYCTRHEGSRVEWRYSTTYS